MNTFAKNKHTKVWKHIQTYDGKRKALVCMLFPDITAIVCQCSEEGSSHNNISAQLS